MNFVINKRHRFGFSILYGVSALPFILLLVDIGICHQIPSPSPRFWVVLQDPPINHTEIETETTRLRSVWPARSLARRNKNGVDLTKSDLALSTDQVEAIERTGANVVCKSRWLRIVSVEADQSQLEALKKLPFVREITPVRSIQKQSTGLEESFYTIDNGELTADETTGFGSYGFSFRQAELARVNEIHERGGNASRGERFSLRVERFDLD